ncbi:MAG: redox-sensing transcriptional repressor Rex [Candidatus Krumholzibacteria bacterium]|jgi:redox-sensing transcriptional repressor|nr:redox-sensing transcriptional repressor Rex [Candidatus Krumholzibacteria bacterium]MDP6668904.1 redox-sensing transcriptional repressor Rex [Candidatus Krumholzibacteria bacterium]MDP6798118.1 redox-sensing transcriptional repressor Rex [Candidatus Krumholzibacteria bacterium]MDP7022288.1 redox-sensing transcriptional repressor Rex [Candidatus Krumholzibacteria bacterium]
MRDESTGNIKGGASEATVRRLSNYFRILEDIKDEGGETISSEKLAARCGITSAQVRKDFSSFGSFGRRGLGYNVEGLKDTIGKILGINEEWNLLLVGAGNLGHALFQYEEFHKQGFHICAILDNNPAKIGQEWEGRHIHAMEDLDSIVKERKIRMGILAIPPQYGQNVANRLVDAGVEGILNFSPTKLFMPDHIYVRNVNLAIALESLSYSLSKHERLKLF